MAHSVGTRKLDVLIIRGYRRSRFTVAHIVGFWRLDAMVPLRSDLLHTRRHIPLFVWRPIRLYLVRDEMIVFWRHSEVSLRWPHVPICHGFSTLCVRGHGVLLIADDAPFALGRVIVSLLRTLGVETLGFSNCVEGIFFDVRVTVTSHAAWSLGRFGLVLVVVFSEGLYPFVVTLEVSDRVALEIR